MKALIAAKADVNLVRIFIPVPQTLLIIICLDSIMTVLTYKQNRFYWFSIQADWEGKTPAHFAAYNGFAEELHLLCTRFLFISPLILLRPAYLGILGIFSAKGVLLKLFVRREEFDPVFKGLAL